MALRMSALDRRYVQVPLQAKAAGAFVNPTADVVRFAFRTTGPPISTDWVTGSWDTDATVTPAVYTAQVLVAGNSAPNQVGAAISLAPGTYTVWIRLTDNPEEPIEPVEILEIF